MKVLGELDTSRRDAAFVGPLRILRAESCENILSKPSLGFPAHAQLKTKVMFQELSKTLLPSKPSCENLSVHPLDYLSVGCWLYLL